MPGDTREILADMRQRTKLTYSALGAVLGFSSNAIHNWMREPGRRISATSESLVRVAHRCLVTGNWNLVTGEVGMPKLASLTDRIEATLTTTLELSSEDVAGGDRYSAAADALRVALEQIMLRDAELRRGR